VLLAESPTVNAVCELVAKDSGVSTFESHEGSCVMREKWTLAPSAAGSFDALTPPLTALRDRGRGDYVHRSHKVH